MAEDRPHIGLLESSLELTAFTDEFHEGIRFNGLVVEREQRDDPLVYAAIEPHDLPTIIVIWLASTYFTEFVKKISGSHFSILETRTDEISQEAVSQRKGYRYCSIRRDIVRSGEIQRPSEYSILFSIWTKAGDCRIKFAFKAQDSEKAYAATAEAILDFLSNYHTGGNSALDRYIIDAINANSQITIAYDCDSDSLYLV